MTIKNSLILVIFSTILILILPHCLTISDGFDSDKEQAFNECLEEVSNQCKSVIEYAVMLEKENARLNRALKSKRNKKCIQK